MATVKKLSKNKLPIKKLKKLPVKNGENQVAGVNNGAPAQHPRSSHTGSNTTKVDFHDDDDDDKYILVCLYVTKVIIFHQAPDY